MENQSLCSFDALDNLVLRRGVDVRPTLLRVLTDLYVQKLRHSPEEERHYTELALRLLQAVDVATRVAVARRLARHLSPPLGVLRCLASELSEIATAAQSHLHSQPPARSNAKELHLDTRPVAEAGTWDEGIQLAGVPQATDVANAAELNELFLAADATERRLILLNLDIVAPLPGRRVGAVRASAVAARLEAAALARSQEDFAVQLARSLLISRHLARRIVRDNLGEPVVVASRALDLASDALCRILMFLNPTVGHSVERVHALAALYNHIRPQAADAMVAIWQALPTNEHAGTARRPPTGREEARQRVRPAAAQGAATPFATSPRRNAS